MPGGGGSGSGASGGEAAARDLRGTHAVMYLSVIAAREEAAGWSSRDVEPRWSAADRRRRRGTGSAATGECW